MPLIQLLEVLIVVGVLLWLVNRFIPMQGSIKSILNGVVVIAVVLWLLNVFGLFHSLSRIRIGTLNDDHGLEEHVATITVETTTQPTAADSAQRRYFENKLLLAVGITLSLTAFAQTNSQTTGDVEPISTTPTFRVNVISRSVQAVNYKHRSGCFEAGFRRHGPDAFGEW